MRRNVGQFELNHYYLPPQVTQNGGQVVNVETRVMTWRSRGEHSARYLNLLVVVVVVVVVVVNRKLVATP